MFFLKVHWMPVADPDLNTGLPRADPNEIAHPSIQPFAAVIAVTSDWVITHISANIKDFLDIDALVLGHTLDHVLLDDAVHDVRGVLNATAGQNGMGRLLGCTLRHGFPQFDLSVHSVETGYILEIEPSEPVSRIDDIGLVRGLFERVRQANTLEDVASTAARALRALTGFDRVAICQVDPFGKACVIQEVSMPGFAPLGTMVKNASNVLPKMNPARNAQLCMISDVDTPPIGLQTQSGDAALDLTHAISAMPVVECVAFARACDAKASFAVSIAQHGTLIGLIICQHQKPLKTGFRTRMLMGLFADLFAYEYVAALARKT